MLKTVSTLGAALALSACGLMAPPAPTAAPTAAAAVEVVWLGQAAFKITSPGGKVIVTEAWLRTNPITPPAYKKLKVFGQGDPDALRHQAAGLGHGPGVQRRDGQQERAEGLHRHARAAPDFLKLSV